MVIQIRRVSSLAAVGDVVVHRTLNFFEKVPSAGCSVCGAPRSRIAGKHIPLRSSHMHGRYPDTGVLFCLCDIQPTGFLPNSSLQPLGWLQTMFSCGATAATRSSKSQVFNLGGGYKNMFSCDVTDYSEKGPTKNFSVQF